MIVRNLIPGDISELRRIHDKFFGTEFTFDELFGNSIASIVITDDEDNIIVGGQLRMIAEVRIVTDKDIKIGQRRRALMRALDVFKFNAASRGFDEIHAFIQDEMWLKHLEKTAGFRKTKGQALVLNL